MLTESENFQALVRSGDMVNVGVDENGQPLYVSKEALSRPFKWLDAESSRGLHYAVKSKGYGVQNFSGFK